MDGQQGTPSKEKTAMVIRIARSFIINFVVKNQHFTKEGIANFCTEVSQSKMDFGGQKFGSWEEITQKVVDFWMQTLEEWLESNPDVASIQETEKSEETSPKKSRDQTFSTQHIGSKAVMLNETIHKSPKDLVEWAVQNYTRFQEENRQWRLSFIPLVQNKKFEYILQTLEDENLEWKNFSIFSKNRFQK